MRGDGLLWRFLSKVAPNPLGCWEWTGYRQPNNGYGKIGLGARSAGTAMAHRVAWELFHGPVPAGMKVMHRCDRPSCVNPTHLALGTQAQNLEDMRRKGRHAHGTKVPQARLGPDDIPIIRTLAAAGATRVALARRFGVSQSAIRHVLKRSTWKHIGEGQ